MTIAIEIPGRGFRRVTLADGTTIDRRHGGGHSRHTYTFRDAESGETVVRDTPSTLRRALVEGGWNEDLADAVRDACLALANSIS